MQINYDIRPYKNSLREKYRQNRLEMSGDKKKLLDKKIFNRFHNLWAYREAQTVLCYVSTDIEVDTSAVIARAFIDGKKVAVPRCLNEEGSMEFYYIDSVDELSPHSFGIPEPEENPARQVVDLTQGLCIIPALSFDRHGYRLGYGKGYYDRFLSRFSGEVLGLCYYNCIADSLPHGKYDGRVLRVLTERGILNISE